MSGDKVVRPAHTQLGLHTRWHVEHWSRAGELLHQEDVHNILHDEGEALFCQILSGNTTLPSTLYLGLDDRASLTEADTITSVTTEPTGNNYLRLHVKAADDWTVQQDGGTSDYEMVTKVCTFNASGGDWPGVDNLFLTTVQSDDGTGWLIASAALSTTRTVTDGDYLNVTMTIRLKESA